MRKVFAHIALWGCALAAMAGDTLILKNNDLLDGELRRIGNGVLVFTADLGGTLMVPVDQVRSLRTGGVYEIEMADGNLVSGRFDADGDRVVVIPHGTRAPRNVDLVQIARVTLIEDPEPVSEEGPERETSGSLQLGMRAHAGEEDYLSPLLGTSLQIRGQQILFRGDAAAALDDAGGFPRYYRLAAAWQIRPLEPVGALVETELRRETARGLDLEATAALSAERRLTVGQSGEAAAAIGLDYTYRAHDLEALYDDNLAFRRAQRIGLVDRYIHDADLNLRLQLRYSQRIFAQGALESRLLLQPGLSDWGALRARLGSRAVFPLYDDVLLQLDLLVEYDDDRPAASIDPWQTSLEASLGWRF